MPPITITLAPWMWVPLVSWLIITGAWVTSSDESDAKSYIVVVALFVLPMIITGCVGQRWPA